VTGNPPQGSGPQAGTDEIVVTAPAAGTSRHPLTCKHQGTLADLVTTDHTRA